MMYASHPYITEPVDKSTGLRSSGVTLAILGLFLLGICTIFITTDGFLKIHAIGIGCGVYHLILGLIAVVAAHNVQKKLHCIISTLVLAVLGCSLFVTTFMYLNFMTWGYAQKSCSSICLEDKDWINNTICNVCGKTSSRFLTISVTLFFLGIADMVLSGVTSCYVCSCCYELTSDAPFGSSAERVRGVFERQQNTLDDDVDTQKYPISPPAYSEIP